MAEYIDRDLIEWYGCDFEEPSCENRDCSGCSHAECSHTQVMQIPPVDVIERDKVNKAIKEMNNIDLNEYADNTYQLVNECIEILKRNIGE